MISRYNRGPHFTDLTRFLGERTDTASTRCGIDALQGNLERVSQRDFIDVGLLEEKEMSLDDRQATRIMDSSIRLTDGHYEVVLSWRPRSLLSPYNKSIALKRRRQHLKKCGGGFNLTKWTFKGSKLLSPLPESEQTVSKQPFNLDETQVQRALGLKWDLTNDAHNFDVPPPDKQFTRRDVLSCFFDL
ncbi:hypothetical protein PHET_10428 [Paragonimus heterotremus]|uniref:Uncharacterized protein n=1 Tax=Paragonimus heterotremus TaxID=100268 RepID=A0A8J4WTQ4_9TREM|nr:hypothetical protein PHET_10428 [Paragonimus heterotremus]